MFARLGHVIARRPLLIILAWMLVLGASVAWNVLGRAQATPEVGSFLPPGSPHNLSSDLIREAFPETWSNSMIAVVGHRPEGLTDDDIAWMDRSVRAARDAIARRVEKAARPGSSPMRIAHLSPAAPFVRERLVSRDGQAALALINLPSNFISKGTIEAVTTTEEIVRRDPPPGLTVEITGSAGIGHDYFLATQKAADRTTWVTVGAVLLILIFVYRSPIGALVPLVSIGISVYVAFVVLGLLTRFGWVVSDMEKIFCVVLMFGAGVDYALFWIARYREGLIEPAPDLALQAVEGTGPDGRRWNIRSLAALASTRETGPAILASAATTICGVSTMLAANLVPSRNAGKVLALALTVALIAALTLVPALARLLGRWLSWPFGMSGRPGPGQRVAWPWLARQVTERPLPVLLTGTLVLSALALWSLRFPPRFDALQELPPDTSSARGLVRAEQHFPVGQLYPNYVLAIFEPGAEPANLAVASSLISREIAASPGVTDVYALDRPVGKATASTSLQGPLLTLMTRKLYEGRTGAGQTVLRFELLMKYPPFSPEAIRTFRGVENAVEKVTRAQMQPAPQIMLSGLTSYILGVQAVVGSDQRRVMVLATLVILVIVFALVRNLGLTVFMVLTTWLTYGATIALTNLFFIHVLGLNGLDWKVRLMLFVIVVAVGQDYNIFLVSRLLKPAPGTDLASATRDAIVRTGSVISSCGLIMAATLGSLWAGGLSLLRQLGFALALGILIDTFFVRPLLIPSFHLVWTRLRGGVASMNENVGMEPQMNADGR